MIDFTKTNKTEVADNTVAINGYVFGKVTDKQARQLESIIKAMLNGETPTKVADPKPTTKATAKAPTTNNKLCKTDYVFTLTLDKDGYITLSTNSGHSKGAWAIASGVLRNQGCTTPDKKDYRYFKPGKGGKISKVATKEVYTNLGGQIKVSANEINAYNEAKYSERA